MSANMKVLWRTPCVSWSLHPCRHRRWAVLIPVSPGRKFIQKRSFRAQTVLRTDYLRLGTHDLDKYAGTREILEVTDEIAEAIRKNHPVVALESTIYTHGSLGNDLDLAKVVRDHGGIPAIIGIVDGVPKIGVTPGELERMISGDPMKVSRRDIAYLVGLGMASRRIHGGTTVAATMLLAKLAGIRVFGTGGLGGVHRGFESYMDVSADLTELGRTRVAVVSSGCKGFLDIPRTLEYLETQGVTVSTFADGRTGDVDFPAFWVRDSGTRSPSVIQDEREAAAMVIAQERLGIESGILFANPIPAEHAIAAVDIDKALEVAVGEAERQGFLGNRNTPFILSKIKELTSGRSVPANKALVEANVARATKIAVEVSRMLSGLDEGGTRIYFAPVAPRSIKSAQDSHSPALGPADTQRNEPLKPLILVAGSVAVDLSCDYACEVAGGKTHNKSPTLQTSNPAVIGQSIGGVGRNVALAAQLVSKASEIKLCSMVGDDIAGATVLAALKSSGLDTSFVRQLGHEYPSSRTAQYVAVNDADKNMMVAMADMAIFTTHAFPAYWKSAVTALKPGWVVVDGNWSEEAIQSWVLASKENDSKVAFEPVSIAKSSRLFPVTKKSNRTRPFPEAGVDLATPNQLELAAMYEAATAHGYFDSPAWFEVIDSFGLTGARERFIRITNSDMTDAGIPIQTIQLLPYIPTIVTKLGPDGALLTTILPKDDPLLDDPDSQQYILARTTRQHTKIGGIYMRLYPSIEIVQDVVSVNGIGDTFLGVLVAGLSQGGRVEELVNVAQKAAVLTLRSKESVSWELGSLESELSRICSK